MRFSHCLVLAFAVSALAVSELAVPAAAAGLPDGVYLSVQFPTDVGMDVLPPIDDSRTESPTASLDVANLTDAPASWTVPSQCEADSWSVTDPSGAVIDSSDPCPPGGAPVTETLNGGQQEQHQDVLPLHVFKYKESTDYTLHYSYWGGTAEAKFTVHYEQE